MQKFVILTLSCSLLFLTVVEGNLRARAFYAITNPEPEPEVEVMAKPYDNLVLMENGGNDPRFVYFLYYNVNPLFLDVFSVALEWVNDLCSSLLKIISTDQLRTGSCLNIKLF